MRDKKIISVNNIKNPYITEENTASSFLSEIEKRGIKLSTILNLLLELGLNKYESKIYMALVEEGISTAKNISDITGIPYGKVYEIINSLSAKGFITILPTKPLKCQAASPNDVLSTIKKTNNENLERIEKSVATTLEPLFTQNKKSAEPKNVFWIVNGRSNINKKIEELVLNAKKYINILTTENGLKKLVFQKDILKNAKERGVEINVSCKITKDNIEDVSSMNELCNMKHCNKVSNSYFSNGDTSIIIEPVPDDENFVQGRDFGIWLSSNSFTKFLDNLFLAHFDKSAEGDKKINDILSIKNSPPI